MKSNATVNYNSPNQAQSFMAFAPIPPQLVTILTGNRASRRAHELRDTLWQHFEPFLAAKGYQIAWDGDNVRSPELRVAANPFSPKPGEAFAAAVAGRSGVKWGGPRAHPFLMGAYDRYHRLVVIKIVSSSGGEMSILQRLSSPTARQDAYNHTIPVLEYLRAGDWDFVVMPAWELTLRDCVPASTAADMLAVAIQCFQGLAYMHKQRIAHLDIYPSNILANHVVHRPREPFLRSFDFRLAYIDFEFSVRVSRTAPLIEVQRLPPTYRELPEVKARCSHVDPFAADVYALGKTLKEHVRSQIEFERDHRNLHPASREMRQRGSRYLALLDRMTSHDASKRPSIEQALQEARGIASSL